MALESFYCFLCWVCVVVIGRYQLECLLIVVHNQAPHGRGAFVIHGVVCRAESSFRKILEDIFVHSNMFRLRAAFHGTDQNGVAVMYIADTNILGTCAGKYWEPSCQVGREDILGFHDSHENLLGSSRGLSVYDWRRLG